MRSAHNRYSHFTALAIVGGAHPHHGVRAEPANVH